MSEQSRKEIFNAFSYEKTRGVASNIAQVLLNTKWEEGDLEYALHLGAKTDNYQGISIVSVYYPDLNAENEEGLSAGKVCVRKSHLLSFEALVRAGFDCHKPDATGESTADFIARTGSTDFAKVMAKHKIDMAATNAKGDTCFITALRNGRNGPARVFFEAGAPVSAEALILARKYPDAALVAAIEKKLQPPSPILAFH